MKMPFLLVIMILLTSACRTPQQKMSRLLKKHPELMQVKKITVIDSIFIPGESDSVHTKLVFKNILMKFGQSFTLRYDSTGRLISDSFRFQNQEIDLSIKVDSSGISFNASVVKKVLEKQNVNLKKGGFNTSAIIDDSSLTLKTTTPDNLITNPMTVECPELVPCEDNSQIKLKFFIFGFIAALFLLMLISNRLRK